MNLLEEGVREGWVEDLKSTRRLTLDGNTKEYNLYKVKLKYLYFNDKNDRIASWISKYKQDNNVINLDKSNIEKYNEIIHNFIKESDASFNKTKNNINMVGQKVHAVILRDGRIIDGNRRFACLRELSQDDEKFGWIETLIVDKDINNYEKEIKIMELNIQHGEEGKQDYNPIDRLVGLYNDVVKNKILTSKEYAKSINENESKIKEDIEVSKLMIDYLKYIKQEECFHVARELKIDGPIREIYKIIKKINNEIEREQVKITMFTILLSRPNGSGDMTRYIRDNCTNFIKNNLLDEFLSCSEDFCREVKNKINNSESFDKLQTEIYDERNSIKTIVDRIDTKVKSIETRNKPYEQFESILNQISDINVDIFLKLSENDLSKIKDKLRQIQEKINIIKEKL